MQVEVFSWIGEDLSPEKDFSIERLVLTPGKGYAHPNDGALVDGKLGSFPTIDQFIYA